MRKIKHQDLIESSISNNARQIAFEYVERVANGQRLNVLTIAPTSGYLVHACKLAGHKISTILPDRPVAQIAKAQQAKTLIRLIADFRSRVPDAKFDLVILEDTLVQSAAPQQILAQCHPLLAEGGAMIVSVTNAVHAPLSPLHAEGTQNTAAGSSHGFTRKAIIDLCIDCEYAVIDLQAVTLTELNQASPSQQANLTDKKKTHQR